MRDFYLILCFGATFSLLCQDGYCNDGKNINTCSAAASTTNSPILDGAGSSYLGAASNGTDLIAAGLWNITSSLTSIISTIFMKESFDTLANFTYPDSKFIQSVHDSVNQTTKLSDYKAYILSKVYTLGLVVVAWKGSEHIYWTMYSVEYSDAVHEFWTNLCELTTNANRLLLMYQDRDAIKPFAQT